MDKNQVWAVKKAALFHFFWREEKASLIFCRLRYDIFDYEGWLDCDNSVYDKAPPALFYSNKGSRIFHFTLMGPHNYIFNLMPIYLFVWLMMGPHIVRELSTILHYH